jgi:hypothetical protein
MTKAMDQALDRIEQAARAGYRQIFRHGVVALCRDIDLRKRLLKRLGIDYDLVSREERTAILRRQYQGELRRCREGHWSASHVRLGALREQFAAERYDALLERAWRRQQFNRLLAA